MKTPFILFAMSALLGCALPIDAQIVPPARSKPAAVSNTAMVFEDRGQSLEILPALRATPVAKPGTSGVQHQLAAASQNAPIGPRNLGVVFNHTLQQQGFLTGEISFKPRGDGPPVGFDPGSYPGLVKVANPNVHVVVASSPREFLEMYGRLKARGDLEWVEAVVVYGLASNQASAPQPARGAP